MEQDNRSSIFSDLSVTPIIGSHLIQTSKWCRFISIVCIIFLAIFLLMMFVAGSTIAPLISSIIPGAENYIGTLLLVVFGVVIIISGVLVFFLLRFSVLTRRGIELRNQDIFNEGLKALKMYFVIYGILAILGVIGNGINLF